jgi:hypothetical protein
METTSFSLERIKIASPCGAAWSEMEGNDGVRFCSKCQKKVYNLSALSPLEAESLLLEMKGQLYPRPYRRTDGTVLTGDCPIGARYVKNLIHDTLCAVAAAVTILFLLGVGRTINKKSDMMAFLRRTEPFASIIRWMAPTPPPPPLPPQPRAGQGRVLKQWKMKTKTHDLSMRRGRQVERRAASLDCIAKVE